MKISVFIPSYNQRALLAEAIESVLAQTLRPHQVIVVDDASTDGSQELIAAYARRYPGWVAALLHERNVGIAQTRVDALSAVTGDYVTYVDGDDRFCPRKLECEAETMRAHPDVGIVFSDYAYISQKGHRIGPWANGKTPPSGDIFMETFGFVFPGRSTFRMEMVEYAAWKQVGFHDTSLRIHEDTDMRIRLTKTCRAAYCNRVLSEVRVGGSGLSKTPAAEHVSILDRILAKNRSLLNDLTPFGRRRVIRQFKAWVGPSAREAARQTMDRGGGRWKALRYYGRSLALDPAATPDVWLAMRLMLPLRVYSGLCRVRNRLQRVRSSTTLDRAVSHES